MAHMQKIESESAMDVDYYTPTHETTPVTTNEHTEAGALTDSSGIDAPTSNTIVYEVSTGDIDAQATAQGSSSESVDGIPAKSFMENDLAETAPNQVAHLGAEQPPMAPEQPMHDEEEGELEYPVPVGPPSPVPTEPNLEPPEGFVPFETIVQPDIVARDFAFSTTPVRPPLYIFPILTTYIWFLYNRHTVIKMQPRILFNRLQSAFFGRDIVYLIHYNWVPMSEISWLDVQQSLGEGLVYLYEHPRDTDITYGARRPSVESPEVRKYFSQFAASRTIKQSILGGVKMLAHMDYERRERRTYGPFGQAVWRLIPSAETVVFEPLYEYLCGRGPRPMLSEFMEHLFDSILNCHGGGVGGRGVPYERPRANDNVGPQEGTDEEEVDIDPDLVTIENSRVTAFVFLRKDRARAEEQELLRQLREAKAELRAAEAGAVAKRHKRRGNGWTRKKTHKCASNATTEVPLEEETRKDEEEMPMRRVTRSVTKAAKQSEVTRKAEVASRKNERKAKAKTLPRSDEAATGTKRRRDEGGDANTEDVNQASSDPGPSKRQTHRVRRKVEPSVKAEPQELEAHANQGCVREQHRGRKMTSPDEPRPRGVKRARSLAPEPSEGAIDAFHKRQRLAEAGP